MTNPAIYSISFSETSVGVRKKLERIERDFSWEAMR